MSANPRSLSRLAWASVTEYAMFTLAPDGTVASWNPGAQRAFGYSRKEIVGKHFAVFFTPDDAADGVPDGELAAAAAHGHLDRDGWHVRKDGGRFWATNTVQPLLGAGGEPVGFAKIVRDATDQYNVTLALRESEERFRLLVDSLDNYAIFSTAPDGRITLWNAGAQRTFGYAAAEILGENFAKLFTEEDRARGVPASELRHARQRLQIDNERWQVRKDGSRFVAERRLVQLQAGAVAAAPGFSVIAHDVTRRRANERTMREQAFYDKLTGLANRALMIEHLGNAIARAKRRPDKRFAVLFLDLDDFKLVNDRVGHVLADGVLADVANRLRACVRPEDVVARMGGDEFTILLGEIAAVDDAVALAGRVHATLATPFIVAGHELAVAASIGIALNAPAGATSDTVLRDADVAMYEAKARGRAQTVVYDDGMRARALSRHQLETDIRLAVERDELFVEYQPILRLADMRLVGFEALVRWNHPLRGVLPPGEFIPAAEQSGSIIPIDRWVLRAASRQLGAWRADLPQAASLAMSVNVSAKQFARTELGADVRAALEDVQLDPAALKLEITESSIMEKSDRAISLLAAIRELDVEIQVDDFGTGYSSLSYLQLFPVSAVKVDRSFITGVDAHEDREQMVRAIVTLAHNLRLAVIAEGIETPDELGVLRGLACELGQGFLFSRPLGAEAARALIARSGTG